MNEEDTSLYVRTVKERLRSVKPVLMTVTVETRYDIIDVETL